MATPSSTLAWRIPWTEEPGRLHVVHGVAKSRTRLSDFTSLHAPRQASLVAQTVKNLPAMQETWIQSLGWEDALEKEMATHSTFLPGKSHGQRSLAGYSPWGLQKSGMTE